MEDGDEKICDICGNLAAMLRYSTSTVNAMPRWSRSMDYLRQYVYLLKSPVEERLEVEITCEESIRKKIIPKIVLQQLVENSMLHGSQSKRLQSSAIKLRGWIEEKRMVYQLLGGWITETAWKKPSPPESARRSWEEIKKKDY